jgi:hypothetical protein
MGGARVSEAGGVPIRVLSGDGPWAVMRSGPNQSPTASFSFLNSFSFYFFCFSKFFHIIRKNASNQFKPLSEIF